MNLQQALNVFGLSGELTEKDVKATFKKLALKFHPDRNPIGSEMMKAINAAYEMIMANIDNLNTYQQTGEATAYNYGEELEKVLNSLHGMLGVVFEVTGNWIWISGETKPHKDQIKEIGCKWSPKKLMWYYRPEEYKASRNRKSHTMDEIRAKYGTSGEKNALGAKRIKA
ncbi:DnaJ domain-containing protein [Salmonella enterica]|nr:DnaJ domain-containing protein [Salmonella enterica]